MDRWKPEMGRVREKRRVEERTAEERRSEKKMQVREKVGKSRNTVFFQWFVAPEGRQVGSLKRRVRSHLARWEMKNCTPLSREAHFQVKMNKTPVAWSTFGSWDVEKAHAVVARSTFRSQNVENTRCGPLLAVEMSKKCTPLWHEAHFEVNMLIKAPGVRSTFGGSDVEKVHAVVARAHFQVKMLKTPGVRTFRCRFPWQAQRIVHLVKVSKTWVFCSIFNHNYTTLHTNTLHYNYNHTFTTFHYTTLYHTPLHSTTLH